MISTSEVKESFSIVIAVKSFNSNLDQCVINCLKLDYPIFEILVLPDNPLKVSWPNVKVIPTGNIAPGQKRNMALKYINSEFIAFIDDDAYPRADWLKNALRNFKNPNVAAVGGPSITPSEDNLRQKASGLIYESILVSGPNNYRYKPKYMCFVDDFPSCNFIVRKDDFEKAGGFNENFWPGEDTIICLNLTKNLKRKIVYDPEVLIYHHRRPVFDAHLRQIASYALHRGYFVKRFPQTSFRISYFMPSALLLYLIAGLLFSMYFSSVKSLYHISLLLYLSANIIVTTKYFLSQKPFQIELIPYLFFGIIITHLVYGVNFLNGLFSKKLQS